MSETASLRIRLLRNLRAGGFNLIATVVIQLLSVPLYLTIWSTQTYGEWLTLTSIAAFFPVVEMGLTSPLATSLSINILRGDDKFARRELISVALIVSCAYFALILLLFMVGKAPIVFDIGIREMRGSVARDVLILQAVYLWLGFIVTTLGAVYRSVDRFATGANIGNAFRLIDFASAIVMLYATKSPIAVAAAPIATRAICVVIMATSCWSLARTSYRLDQISHCDLAVSPPLHAAGLASMLTTIASALVNQIPVILLGRYEGASSVALFSAMRTLSRVPTQLSGMLQAIMLPEMTRLTELDLLAQARRLVHTSIGALTAIGVAGLFMLLLVGEPFFRHWTRGHLHVDSVLLFTLTLASVVSMISGIAINLLYSRNSYSDVARASILVYGLVALVWLVSNEPHLMATICFSILIAETVLAFFYFRSASSIIREPPAATVTKGIERLMEMLRTGRL